ncbi:uncharacterized protein LOC142972498 [Anticarsia gemmatalis]|uniref:uncharacterized protein LOC142972498 n=1 Tax=Anticarsia gemmatalis TaxID=129554 RepID=UPI003F772B79
MKSADLPKEKAYEPDEGAHQPLLNNMPPFTDQNTSKKLTFAKNVDFTDKPSSQTNSSYKDVLSQPATSLSHSQRLLWLQKRRTAGLWVQCDDCDRWRYLPNVIDRHELPKKWYCSMNSDPDFSNCSVPEAPLRLHDEEDLIHSEYTAGSLVWARLTGWPWWPAMVDDCPDAEQFYWLDGFSDIPTHYNVVFFDNMEVTRAWIAPENLKPYAVNKNTFKHLPKNKKFHSRLRTAMSQADEAENMTLAKRLDKFSFISRHKGNINSPKKINKNDLKKYQRRFKNKFNIEFPIENSDSEEDRMTDIESLARNNNVIILGTPKRARKENSRTSTMRMLASTDSAKATNEEPIQNNSETHNSKEDVSDKPSNSMLAQVGSTEATTVIDNDTSTTYLPERESENLSVRVDTPNSDDFEF